MAQVHYTNPWAPDRDNTLELVTHEGGLRNNGNCWSISKKQKQLFFGFISSSDSSNINSSPFNNGRSISRYKQDQVNVHTQMSGS